MACLDKLLILDDFMILSLCNMTYQIVGGITASLPLYKTQYVLVKY